MADSTMHNPWKGLNFYTEGERLYGRNVEIISLSQYIFNNTQTVLYGRSGIGKSSILNAGIFPKARLEGMVPVSIRLKHGAANDYLAQIRQAMEAAGLSLRQILPAIENPAGESLWEFMHRHEFFNDKGEKCIPLLVFDQFEEIFSLQSSEGVKRDFFKQLGDLLNDVKPGYVAEHESLTRRQTPGQETNVVAGGAFKGLNIKLNVRRGDAAAPEAAARYIERPQYHMVFALREDFLSSLEIYAASIPVMKDNRFGLLPINEEQAADIIRLPRPGLVDDAVTKLIIEQVTGRSDFELDGVPEIEVDSAVLSLFLSRLYIKKPQDEPTITAELVRNSSGHIIHDFYVESITPDPERGENLSQKSILILEDRLLTGDGRRNNVSRNDLIRQGVTAEELSLLIDKRKLLRQFSHGNDIRIEFIHDILCPVVKERREQREILRQQQEEKERQEAEKQRIIAEAEARALRIKRRNRRIFTWTAVVLAIVAVAASIIWYNKVVLPTKVYEKYYASFELVNGWPVGVGELSARERARTPLYYRISHVGEEKHDTDVEVMSSNSMLPATERIANWPEICTDAADAAGTAFNSILSRVAKIHFSATKGSDKVEKMELLDARGNPLMLMTYFHLNDGEAWLNYTSTNGQPMTIRDNGIDRVKMSWDSVGRIVGQRYFTAAGVPKEIHRDRKVAGFYRNYPASAPGTTEFYTLNIYGLPNTDTPYNVKRVTTRGDSTISEYFKAKAIGDASMTAAVGDHGYSRIVTVGGRETLYIPGVPEPVAVCLTEYDGQGNALRQTITGSVNDSLPPVIEWKYKGNTGLLTEQLSLTTDGKPFGRSAADVYKIEKEYDDIGALTAERRTAATGEVVYVHRKTTAKKGDATIITDVLEDKLTPAYLTVVDTISHGRTATAYFGRNGAKINRKAPFWADDSVMCHIWIKETDGNTATSRFYAVNDLGEVGPVAAAVDPLSYRTTAFMLRKISDDNGNVTNMEILDSAGKPLTRMMYIIQNGEAIGRAAWGIDDTPVRCDDWEEEKFEYYKIYYSKDFKDDYTFLQPFDEWMHNSVFFTGASYGKVESIDLNGKEIMAADKSFKGSRTITKPFTVYQFESDPSVTPLAMPYLHITAKDSPLYKAGLRDGDRIVRLGSWRLGEGKSKFDKEWQALADGSRDIDIELLHPTTTGFAKAGHRFAAGSSAPINAHYHFMQLSEAEKSFYETHSK